MNMGSPVALVTGGASGIGLAVTEHLIHHYGYKVAIVDISAERVKEQSERLGSTACLGIQADISDYDQQSKAFLQAFECGGNRLDLFFANAGIGDDDSLYKDMQVDENTGLPQPLSLRTIDVNLYAVLQGIHLARHFFCEKNSKKGGRIVVTSSVAGLYPLYTLPIYTASKHGIVGLVRSLAPIYLKDNITVNALNPTLVDTNLMPKHVAEKFKDPRNWTPMSTVLKAFDAVLHDKDLTGQTMELALGDVVFKQQPQYSTSNIEWMFGMTDMWEEVCEPLLPRKPGENAAVVKKPEKESI
jgi:15-hydroxyprostaglandin dehydrogenase (NAD)